ncbi:hypothetical protein Vadar_020326 [Vaccinium darrowii]|uniref:Uncharacterized protein n=1 Tax=Vaccinium darrowii TaxID=229202 RepID=A0ACB7Y0D7_9ERIC|nr:hypothetical protein Vadar_020326 [Vaccinium darrowii]
MLAVENSCAIFGIGNSTDRREQLKQLKEMQAVGVKPIVKTYTTLIHEWARVCLPEKALRNSSLCGEMVQSGLTVNMGTAVHSKCLHKIERAGGEITEALQKTFPPD